MTDRVLNLGRQPASDAFPPANDANEEARWPLELWYCTRCHLAQLAVDPPLPEPPLAVESATMARHARETAVDVISEAALPAGSTVAEAASHHGGSWMPYLVASGLVPQPLEAEGSVDLLVDVHGLAHEPDTETALAAHARRLSPTGRLVLEFHHLLSLVTEGQFDTVRLGHPVYLSVLALQQGLRRHDLVVTDAVLNPAYGGSLRVTARRDSDHAYVHDSVDAVLDAERSAGLDSPDGLRPLQAQADRSARALRRYLEDARTSGRTVLGYGAPSKASVLLCYSGVDDRLLPATADLSPAKHGRRLPGCGVPIVSPEALLAARPDDVLILTWDIAEEVVRQLAALGQQGSRFLVPVPEPRELPARTG